MFKSEEVVVHGKSVVTTTNLRESRAPHPDWVEEVGRWEKSVRLSSNTKTNFYQEEFPFTIFVVPPTKPSLRERNFL
ncbi:hypothetical protein A0128_07810 [Leptospira tipperaryensis]|uniref:Uncharacterized protein n=1 Tax=Leptospira tipperaryensis TaxID=2564040 RepID=A0A1D7UVX7_9LEPT|nr:hypothetical protein A0128_07810 [Leptospira tipperaryensis]